VTLAPVTQTVAGQAAALRAEHNLSVPDAVVAATALDEHCGYVVANDAVFQRVPGFRTLLVQDYVRN
jgi:predicted nucleic acid-binding protein